MNREELYSLLDTIPVAIPVYIEDKHGVGKSECIYQYTVSRKIKYICIILSQRTEGDFIGIPQISMINDKAYSTFAPPDLFAIVSQGNGILFLDEFPDANVDIRNAAQEIICARSLNGHKLGDGWRVVLAGNPPDTIAYQTGDLRPQFLSRVLRISFSVSSYEWLEYMKKIEGHHAVISFIAKNEEHLLPPDSLKMNTTTPCPRTWKYLSDILKSDEKYTQDYGLLLTISLGLIGLETATVFKTFVEKEFKLPKLDDVKKGKFPEMYIEDVPICSGIVRELATENIKKWGKKETENIKEWFNKLPLEVRAVYVRILVNNSNDSAIMNDLEVLMSEKEIEGLFESISEMDADEAKNKVVKEDETKK